MSGLYYTNPYVNDFSRQNIQQYPLYQYGVGTGDEAVFDGKGAVSQNGSQDAAVDFASAIPFIGPLLGAGMNIISQFEQNRVQRDMYDTYMSPQARMAQMKAAGINPNAAAQGIAGAPAAQINAAAPTNAFSSLGEQLGNSVNTALTGKAIKANIENINADTRFKDSLNVEKTTTNKYLDRMQNATLRNLVNQGDISEHQANIIAVDDYYHGAEAAAHLEQSFMALRQMAAELKNTEQEYNNMLAQEYATMMAGQLSEAQIHKVFSDIGLNNAQINKIAHEVENIDASTMATMQNISESQCRERLTRAQAQYQEKVNSVWQNSGWNMNSDVNSNFYSLCMQGDVKGATKLLQGTRAMVYNYGDARVHSKDYMMDKGFELIGDIAHVMTFGGLGSTPMKGEVRTMRDSKGNVIGSTATDYVY